MCDQDCEIIEPVIPMTFLLFKPLRMCLGVWLEVLVFDTNSSFVERSMYENFRILKFLGLRVAIVNLSTMLQSLGRKSFVLNSFS